jgi:hypothetical protein
MKSASLTSKVYTLQPILTERQHEVIWVDRNQPFRLNFDRLWCVVFGI